jgi:polysaccharide export outer membrane protein
MMIAKDDNPSERVLSRSESKMHRKIVVLMIVAILGGPFWVLSCAGNGEAGPLADAQAMPEGRPPDATPAGSLPAGRPSEEGYLIGAGDVLDISVWKDEALTRSCVVRPDGAISFPLIGDVMAAGRTASQLKAEMGKQLDRYVPGVVVSIEVKQVNSLIIYVIGKVNAPGRFIMNTNVDVLQALATAGGLNIFAKSNDIKIFRQEKLKTTIFPFEYDKVVDGKRLEQNIQLKRGDVVVIP